VRVPYGNVNLLKIPDDVADEQALYLSDVLPTSYHAVVDTGVTDGDVVGVWGLGPIGRASPLTVSRRRPCPFADPIFVFTVCVAKWAQLKGAKTVIGIDLVPSRLAYAKEKLGIEVFDASGGVDVAEGLLKLFPDGLDVAIDAGSFHEPKTVLQKVEKALMLETDVSETVNECIKAVRKRGHIGLIAAYSSYTNHFNIGSLMEKCVSRFSLPFDASPARGLSFLTKPLHLFPFTGASASRATVRLRSTSTGRRSSTTTSARARCGSPRSLLLGVQEGPSC